MSVFIRYGQGFDSPHLHQNREHRVCSLFWWFVNAWFENQQGEALSGFERGASRVRRTFVKRMKFFETKSEDTFNASDSRHSPHLQFLTVYLFLYIWSRTRYNFCDTRVLTSHKTILNRFVRQSPHLQLLLQFKHLSSLLKYF